jgi:formylglycine-generating enzyme required for sulfatase activity
MKKIGIVIAVIAIGCAVLIASRDAWSNESADSFVNSLGMKMVRIHAGKFQMGSDLPTDPAQLRQFQWLTHGDYDEKPVHEVTIAHDFFMAQTEVTAGEYVSFRADYQNLGPFPPYVTGVSWDDAQAFCRWLSKKDKKNYRLPTEAEWEYAARAGTVSNFSSGDLPPAIGDANAWGLENMEAGPPEWVQDWYGPYSPSAEPDPVGPGGGVSRVVRGGGIPAPKGKDPEGFAPYYRRSANRASVAPQYAGRTPIGFRVVEAVEPQTKPAPAVRPFPEKFVKQTDAQVNAGPDPDKPWFRQRNLLPVPPEDMMPEEIAAAGVDPGVGGHNHSAGLAVCPNGDVLAIAFSAPSSSTEYVPATSFVVTRLRYGSEEWDMPQVFYDFADVNDQSALLWNDNGVVRFFGGGVGLSGVPFRWQSSRDNGANWSAINFPLLHGPIGGFFPQPITNAFRTGDGTMYMGTDAIGGASLLWASHDEGRTWIDTGGRTAGRHTAFVVLKDGSILGMGGKNTDIDGYMPQAISRDGGRSWTVSKSPFAALASNQRPTMIRLKSGRLFFAADFQDRKGKQPEGITEHGAFVALSNDEGKSWHIKKLPGVLPHEAWVLPPRDKWSERFHGYGTLGYAVSAQAPNGVIYLITSMNHPSQQFEMNEKWILSDSDASATAELVANAKSITGLQNYSNGRKQAEWSGKIDSDGRYLLDGQEAWFYPSGKKQYQVEYRDGHKIGSEIQWAEDGTKISEWEHRGDGVSIWTEYWPKGQKKHESHWKNGRCTGEAQAWSPSGKSVGKWLFENGHLQR